MYETKAEHVNFFFYKKVITLLYNTESSMFLLRKDINQM